jgi:hypothetical protein
LFVFSTCSWRLRFGNDWKASTRLNLFSSH